MEAVTIMYIMLAFAVLFEMYGNIKRYQKKKIADRKHAKRILCFINEYKGVEIHKDLWHYRYSLKQYDKTELVRQSLDYFNKDIKKIGYDNWNTMTKFLRKKAGI